MTQQTKATRQSRVAETRPNPVTYDGQLGPEQIADIFADNRQFAAQQREDFLKAHPHYSPCSVAGCEGLVGPNYQRVTPNGRSYGFCPRRQAHARLMPQIFRAR